MLTSSLLGVKRLLSLLIQDGDRAALEERLAHLVNSGKFWKYGKHKTPQVLALHRHHLFGIYSMEKKPLQIKQSVLAGLSCHQKTPLMHQRFNCLCFVCMSQQS